MITYHATLAAFTAKAVELRAAGYALEPSIQSHSGTHQPSIRAFKGDEMIRVELNAMNNEAYFLRRTHAFDLACEIIDNSKGN